VCSSDLGLLSVQPLVNPDTMSKVLIQRFGKDMGEKNVQVLLQGIKGVREA
jgi:hypothetical protein